MSHSSLTRRYTAHPTVYCTYVTQPTSLSGTQPTLPAIHHTAYIPHFQLSDTQPILLLCSHHTAHLTRRYTAHPTVYCTYVTQPTSLSGRQPILTAIHHTAYITFRYQVHSPSFQLLYKYMSLSLPPSQVHTPPYQLYITQPTSFSGFRYTAHPTT
jgi:hypothetical protein